MKKGRKTSPAKLEKYRAKRDFTKTKEPSGARKVLSAEHRRFVIQKHAASHLHYDLRLELNGVFKSWAVTKGPSIDPADKRLAVEVEDHPLDYGDFEGTIPKGEYGGGTVQMWDRGLWAPQGPKSPEAAIAAGELKFVLVGERLKGSFVLVKIRNNRGRDTRTNWLLIKHKDEYAVPGGTEALIAEDRSVASGRTMDQITRGVGKAPKPFMLAQAAEADAVWHSNRTEPAEPERASPKRTPPSRTRSERETPKRASPKRGLSGRTKKTRRESSMPEFIEPQLCKLVERPPMGAGWVHEIKFDGYRVQLRVEDGKATIRTRSGLDWTQQLSAIAKAARHLPDCMLDGEICAVDKNNLPSFAGLQAALAEENSEGLVFFAFDLLIDGKEDCREMPLSARKSRLKAFLEEADAGDSIRFVEHFESSGNDVWQSACKMNLEGIVSKRENSFYVSGRHGGWTKAKCRAGQEVVLGGWTTENGQLRSLLAGMYRDGRLEYVGRIGTGYGAKVAGQVLPTLKKLTTDTSPFTGKDAPPKEHNVRWLKPQLVAEINFAGWTDTRMIRHASFKGLRPDKPPEEVVDEVAEPTPSATREAASKVRKKSGASTTAAIAPKGATAAASVRRGPNVVMGVTISSADKVMWPASAAGGSVTKLDHANYYEAVGDWLIPHLRGRPCSLVRAPDGIIGEQFFQRHAMAGISDLFTLVKVKQDKTPYVQIDRVEALIAVAQIGALELHPWNCAEGNPEVAGRLVFDLDPAPDVKFSAVIEAALEIRERLKDVGLESFCKTTGGKGLHVVTPLTGGEDAVPWPAAKNFAHIICAQMASDSPKKYLDTMAKKDRVGRIFLDYLRNDRTATAVAVLSTRARPGAPISMPIHWKDVKATLKPERYDIRTGPALLRKSKPWTDYDRAARSLSAAIEAVLSQGRAPMRKRA